MKRSKFTESQIVFALKQAETGVAVAERALFLEFADFLRKTKRVWCRRGDSNPHELPHTPLKRARLPVPPLRLDLLDDCHPENPSRGDAVTTDCSLGHEEKPTSSSFPDLPLASHQSTTLHLYPGKN